MQRTARRFCVSTLVLFAFGLTAAQAQDSTNTEPVAQVPAGQFGPFVQSAIAEQQASSVLSTLIAVGTPAGLSGSAARLSSESVRVQFWRPATRAAVRTVVVREGQSLWDIASASGISVETIALANNLTNAAYVKPGQRLLIPEASDPRAPAKLAAKTAKARAAQPHAQGKAAKVQGKAAKVQGKAAQVQGRAAKAAARSAGVGARTVTLGEGQTLWSLARAHGVSVGAIVEANRLRNADRVRAGTRLVIPGRAVSSGARVATARIAAPRAGEVTKAASISAVRVVRGFLWPARGILTSRFGWRRRRHHDGIDIAAPYGASVFAARPGRVVFSGWYYAYGRTVILDHGNGLQTIYGHASKLLVDVGQSVTQGELIARVGATGRATGPHLHFEVRVKGKAVNPMRYMN